MEILNAAHNLIRIANGDFKLIPFYFANLVVGQRNALSQADISNIVLPHLHAVGVEYYFVLKITFRFAKGVVAVDVFHIGQVGGNSGVSSGIVALFG